MKYPDVIFATEKIGSNGISCLDYKNKDDDVKYIRADLVKLQNTSSNSNYEKLKGAIESIADYGGCLTGEDAQEMKQIAIKALQ